MCSPFSKFKSISVENGAISAIIWYLKFEIAGAIHKLTILHFVLKPTRIQLYHPMTTNCTIGS